MKLGTISSLLCLAVIVCAGIGMIESPATAQEPRAGRQLIESLLPERWEYSEPLILPEDRESQPSVAQKDPSVVFHEGKWHVFMTIKLGGKTAMEYCSFETWEQANQSPRTRLRVTDSNYYAAPQVFFFEPHRKWYMIYQVGVPNLKKMWVAYSTTDTIDDPSSWTAATPILDGGPSDPRQEGGLDYWIICDENRAHLFLTTNNGKMWRLSAAIADFPRGFDQCQLALQGEVFEASHTYRIRDTDQYLTIIEADGRRFYKAFVADRLDGAWTEVKGGTGHAFAELANIQPAAGVAPWTDNVSHGELIRSSNDQTLTIDLRDLRFVFQGMLESEKKGKKYGEFPWRIGMLVPVKK